MRLATARDRPLLVAAAGAACISSSAVLVQLAATGATATAFFRCALALPALGAVALVERRRSGPLSRSHHVRAAGAGVAFAIDLVLWNHAIADVGAGVATVLGNLQVLFVAIAAWAIFRERPSARFALALPIVAAGVVLVAGVVGGSSFGRHPMAGIVYGVGTSIAYAVFLLVMRSVSTGTAHVAAQLFDATASAGISAMLAGVVAGTMQFDPGWPALGWLATLAIVSQVLGWLLITTSLPRLPAAVSSVMLLLQPAASMALAAVVLSERPTGWQLGGAALVCAGVLVAVTRSTVPEGDLVPGRAGGARAPA